MALLTLPNRIAQLPTRPVVPDLDPEMLKIALALMAGKGVMPTSTIDPEAGRPKTEIIPQEKPVSNVITEPVDDYKFKLPGRGVGEPPSTTITEPIDEKLARLVAKPKYIYVGASPEEEGAFDPLLEERLAKAPYAGQNIPLKDTIIKKEGGKAMSTPTAKGGEITVGSRDDFQKNYVVRGMSPETGQTGEMEGLAEILKTSPEDWRGSQAWNFSRGGKVYIYKRSDMVKPELEQSYIKKGAKPVAVIDGKDLKDTDPYEHLSKLSPTGAKGGEYLYHGTNEDVLDSITKDGLKPMGRGELSLSRDEAYAKGFAREGMTPKGKTNAVVLRVNADLLKGKTIPTGKSRPASDQLYESLTKETIPPESLEIYENGKWQPLTVAKGGEIDILDADIPRGSKVVPLNYGALDNVGRRSFESVAKENKVDISQVRQVNIPLDDLNPKYKGSADPDEMGRLDNQPAVEVSIGKDGKFKILDGNHRISAAQEQGYTHIPAWVVDKRISKLSPKEGGDTAKGGEIKIPKSIQNYLNDEYGGGDEYGNKVLEAIKDGTLKPENFKFIGKDIIDTDLSGLIPDRISDSSYGADPSLLAKTKRQEKALREFRKMINEASKLSPKEDNIQNDLSKLKSRKEK